MDGRNPLPQRRENNGWSALIEGEGVIALAHGYNDGTNGKTLYPLVVDPENIELNRNSMLRVVTASSVPVVGTRFPPPRG